METKLYIKLIENLFSARKEITKEYVNICANLLNSLPTKKVIFDYESGNCPYFASDCLEDDLGDITIKSIWVEGEDAIFAEVTSYYTGECDERIFLNDYVRYSEDWEDIIDNVLSACEFVDEYYTK